MNRAATGVLLAVAIACLAGCGGAGRAPGTTTLGLPTGAGFPDFRKGRTFNPTPYPQGNWRPAGLVYRDVWFRSGDGTLLHGWYVPCEDPRAVVLYCHGNSGNLSHRADVLRTLHDEVGVTVFIFDYRGYGRSHGRPTEQGILADARAARAWLARCAGVDEHDVVLLGHALGSGVAVDLAATDGARALVLESAFTSVPDVGASYFPRLPVRLLTRTELDSYRKIRRYHGPLLQSHGRRDTIVPYRLGQRLYLAANQPKEFITLEGHDHMDPLGAEYYGRLATFLDHLQTPAGYETDVAGDRREPAEAGMPTSDRPRREAHAAASSGATESHRHRTISVGAR